MKKIFLPLLFLAFSAPIFAHSVEGRATDRFNYSAADLSAPATIAELHGQIERFARSYCNVRPGSVRDLSFLRLCSTRIEEEIVRKIGDARLTAYAVNG